MAKHGEVPKALASEMIELLPKLPRRQGTLVAPATVHAALLAGEEEALFQMLDKQENYIRAAAYIHMLQHGGSRVIPRLRELLEKKDVLGVAVLDLARRRLELGEGERAPLCELAGDFLGDERPGVTSHVGLMTAHCGGKYADALLKEVDRRIEAKTLTRGLARSTNSLCVKHGRARTPTLGDAQCAHLRDQLERLLTDEGQNLEARQSAMLSLGHQFPDDRTLELLGKYKDHSAKPLRFHARNLIRSIVELQRVASADHPGN